MAALEKPPLRQSVLERQSLLEINPYLVSREWATWLTKLWTVTTTINSSGTTANRPTKGLFIGMPYFDTTLAKPIWLQSVGPVVWCDATGAAV